MKHKFSFLAISYLLSLVCLPCDLYADNRSVFGTRKQEDLFPKTESTKKSPAIVPETEEPDIVKELRKKYEEEIESLEEAYSREREKQKQKTFETIDTGLAVLTQMMRIEDVETLVELKDNFPGMLSIKEIKNYPKDIQILIKNTQKQFSDITKREQKAFEELNKKYTRTAGALMKKVAAAKDFKSAIALRKFTEDLKAKEKEPSGAHGKKFSAILKVGTTLELLKIPAGSFMMGSPNNEEGRDANEKQVHVTITKPFYLGRTEVTQEQYEAVMGKNPSHFKGTNLPVENVSWHDAMEFCNKLNKLLGKRLPMGYKFTLPSEAQWEYACRAGTKTAFHFGNSAGNLSGYAWWQENSNNKTHPVASKGKNAWGLYDMHGNVVEWCLDTFKTPLPGGKDPTVAQGYNRIVRGGSWYHTDSVTLRSGRRHAQDPGLRFYDIGFRVALVQE